MDSLSRVALTYQEDRAVLDGAPTTVVRKLFNEWAATGCQAEQDTMRLGDVARHHSAHKSRKKHCALSSTLTHDLRMRC
jgi:hypothetical protein